MRNKYIFIRFFAFLLVSTILFCFVSCGSEPKRRDNISDAMYEYGIAAVEIADDYLSGKITAKEAADKLKWNNSLQDARIDSERKEYGDGSGEGSLIGTPVSQDSSINLNSHLLYYALYDKSNGTGVDADIKKARDRLAAALWK